MPTTNKVTNRAILDALIELGHDPALVNSISTRGAQGSTFRSAVFGAIRDVPAFANYTVAVETFDRAKAVAAWRPDPKRSLAENLRASFEVRGVDWYDNLDAVEAQATKIFRSRPGVSKPGQRYTDADLLQAVADVIGKDNPALVRGAMQRAGVAQIPTSLAPPPTPEAPAPSGRGGPQMRITGPTAPEPGLVPGAAPRTPTPGAPGAPGAGGLPGGAPGGLPDDAAELGAAEAGFTESDLMSFISAQYGAYAWALNIPDVAKVLKDATDGDWDPSKTQAAIQSTEWWKTTRNKQKQWLALESTSPTEAQVALGDTKQAFLQQTQKMGFAVAPERLEQIARLSLQLGWTDAEQTQALAAEFDFQDVKSSERAKGMRRVASDYALPISDASVEKWGRLLLSGQVTDNDYRAYLTEQAKSMFPGLTAALDRGLTVKEYASSYVELAAKRLEIDPETIDLSEGKWNRLINQVDPKTGEHVAMSLAEAERTIRLDPQYGYSRTRGAIQEATTLAEGLKRTMGLSA